MTIQLLPFLLDRFNTQISNVDALWASSDVCMHICMYAILIANICFQLIYADIYINFCLFVRFTPFIFVITKQCMHSQWLQVRIQLDFARILLKATRQLITHGCPVSIIMQVEITFHPCYRCIATVDSSIWICHIVIASIRLSIQPFVMFCNVFLVYLEIHRICARCAVSDKIIWNLSHIPYLLFVILWLR